MSEGEVWDRDWWRKAKAASLDRRARTATLGAIAKPGDAVLVVTEGTVTEPVYFELLRQNLRLSVVRIKVQPGDASDPRHVIRTAVREAREQTRRGKRGSLGASEPARFDHVWAVVDTDVAVRNGIWNDVEQLAAANNVKLAHSTPCFEFWLLLHLEFTTRTDLFDGERAKAALKDALRRDYSTDREVAREVIAMLLPAWLQAVERAGRVRQYHQGAATSLPANPSTEVDRLVQTMRDVAPTARG